MARILFTWELGRGFGHLAAYRRAFALLAERGHSILLAVRDLANTERVYGCTAIPAVQAPILANRSTEAVVKVYSYAQLMQNMGFADTPGLLGRIMAWRYLYDSFKPDLVLYDHSPTAMLAYRSREARQIFCGNGFFLPPLQEPLPAMRYWENIPREDLLALEQPVLACINEVLSALDDPPLPALWRLFDRIRPILCTIRELDHYPDRQGVEYHGILSSGYFGEPPSWPAGTGPRVFGYLYPFQTLPALLQWLKERGLPTLIYAPEVSESVKAPLRSERLQFVPRPLAIHQVCADCDLGITCGNFGTTANILLAGKPVLVTPLDLEKYMLGRRVEALGAGLVAPGLQPAGMTAKLQTLLEDGRYRLAAEQFATRYAGGAAERQPEALAEMMEKELDF